MGTGMLLLLAGLSLVTTLASTGYNAYNAERQREFSAQEASKQRIWEKEMSDTAVIRRMDDLRAAGMNPALAVDNAASTPAGAVAASSSAARADTSVLSNSLGSLMKFAGDKKSAAFNDYSNAYDMYRQAEESLAEYGDKEAYEYYKTAEFLMNSAQKKVR
nr:MAG TPA: minor capsid protein [Microviridae sp.]